LLLYMHLHRIGRKDENPDGKAADAKAVQPGR
jgi:hypothetical protein